MAEKRMFSNKITQSDPFLSMPASAQSLYFHLSMDADDDGFVNRPKAIMRMVNASDDDMNILIVRKFIIPFDVEDNNSLVSMICVIKHWFIHNNIRNDRKKDTTYIKERDMLVINDNGAYSLPKDTLNTGLRPLDNQPTTKCQHSVLECIVLESSVLESSVDAQSEAIESDKKRKDKDIKNQMFEKFWSLYPRKVNKKKSKDIYLKKITIEDHQKIMSNIMLLIHSDGWKDEKFIPHPTTYLNNERWNDEVTSSSYKNKTILNIKEH